MQRELGIKAGKYCRLLSVALSVNEIPASQWVTADTIIVEFNLFSENWGAVGKLLNLLMYCVW